jgi:hypothetical protein
MPRAARRRSYAFVPSGRVVVGASHDDVVELQTRVKQQQVALSAVVADCLGKLDEPTKQAWYALAAKCVAYASTNAPLLFGVDDMAAQGESLLKELATWTPRLQAAGCSNVPAAPAEPPPPPTPAPPLTMPSLFGALETGSSIVLLGLAYLVLRELR